jgi:DNA-binding MarR family transcriptional regulator
VPLNINASQSDAAANAAGAGVRRATSDEVINELTAWNPRERMGMFRRWLAGSLSIVHLHVLTVLETGGPLPMGRLADALDVSVASATGIVDRMEQRGLIERRDDDRDRRIVVVHPTAAGLGVFADLDEQRRASLRILLERLTDRELKSFLVGLRAMRAAREAMAAEAAAAAGMPAEPVIALQRALSGRSTR